MAVTVQEETVTIPKIHYDALVARRDKLEALEAAGVDNWDGYSEAMQNLTNEEEN